MDLDQVLLGDVVACQEGRHILALITLQLDDVPQLAIFNNSPVATELCALKLKASARSALIQANKSQRPLHGKPCPLGCMQDSAAASPAQSVRDS